VGSLAQPLLAVRLHRFDLVAAAFRRAASVRKAPNVTPNAVIPRAVLPRGAPFALRMHSSQLPLRRKLRLRQGRDSGQALQFAPRPLRASRRYVESYKSLRSPEESSGDLSYSGGTVALR
jgi:hypothetical protein